MTTNLEASPQAAVDARPVQEKPALAATIIDLDCGVLLRIEGDAGVVGLEALQFAFARVIARRALLAVLDLGHLTFVSSLAIGQLVRLSRDLNRWNGRVRIASCPPMIRETLEAARVASFFVFHASVEEAISAV
jgi:anti-anti-sigma factor